MSKVNVMEGVDTHGIDTLGHMVHTEHLREMLEESLTWMQDRCKEKGDSPEKNCAARRVHPSLGRDSRMRLLRGSCEVPSHGRHRE